MQAPRGSDLALALALAPKVERGPAEPQGRLEGREERGSCCFSQLINTVSLSAAFTCLRKGSELPRSACFPSFLKTMEPLSVLQGPTVEFLSLIKNRSVLLRKPALGLLETFTLENPCHSLMNTEGSIGNPHRLPGKE